MTPRSSRSLGIAIALLAATAFGPGLAEANRGRHGPAKAPRVTPKKQQDHRASLRPEKKKSSRITFRSMLKAARQEFQLYRGDHLERWANRIRVGKSDFNSKKSVKSNLEALVKEKSMEHYYAKVNGADVLHVVVNLGQGKATKENLRSVMRRVSNETVELNYKAPTNSNPYGHVAVRVGNGAFYDLTGTQGMTQLPKFMEKMVNSIRGTTSLTFARKRNMRRFMESRDGGSNVFYGMLFAAGSGEVKETQTIYNKRIKEATKFNVAGGDASKGEYSCAQFLTENVPFFNSRGVNASIGATSTANAARSALKLEAVVVYKMPGANMAERSDF